MTAAKKDEKSGGGRVAPTCLSAQGPGSPTSLSILGMAFFSSTAPSPFPKIETARFRMTSAAADHHLSRLGGIDYPKDKNS
ncbi:hypothetical protein B0H65DRAFT_466551 [Neurospora tetraspora]|uniref:Uncharacterized protein n=1 Tax=Neurospora tetraspora TaxID=94610 RepID=A0AAE0JFH0_9PEZI|nr:hypothetical protein B0H65DRAFT_466551 [Neurospora tetraspora]